MIRHFLLVLDRGACPTRIIRTLEDLLDRLDPVVDLLSHAEVEPQLQPAQDLLAALDVRFGEALVTSQELGAEVVDWLSQSQVQPMVVFEGLPPRQILGSRVAPLLLLPRQDEPLRLREVLMVCPEAPGAAAMTLAGVCRGGATGVVLLEEGRDDCRASAAQESGRRRLEASGAPTLVRRRLGTLSPDDLLAEAADADANLVVVEASRATDALLSTLLSTRRAVLVLPGHVKGAGAQAQACA